jgi:membrane-associated phospholipid phosphatase
MFHAVLTTVKYVAAGGGIFLIKSIGVFFLYASLRYLIIKRKVSPHIFQPRSTYEKVLRSSLIMIGVLMLSLVTIGVLVDLMDNSPAPRDVIHNSRTLMEIDRDMFGVYPTIWLHRADNPLKAYLDLASPMIVGSYAQLGILISFLLFGALAFDQKLLFRLLVAFVLSVLVSLPLWIAYPAVSPNEAFFANRVHADIPIFVAEEMESFAPNPYMSRVIKNIGINSDTGEGTYYAISTMPSMHITWAIFVLYYGVLLYRRSALYLVPYFIINAFSTVFLLQHYTIDIAAGMVVGMLIIVFVERATMKTPALLIPVGEALHDDLKYTLSILTRCGVSIGVLRKKSL